MDRIAQLKRRRRELEESLEGIITELCESEIRAEVNSLLEQIGVTNGYTISWDFCGESDDEGGTYYAPDHLTIEDDNGDTIDLHELEVFSVKGREYATTLGDVIYDLFYDFKDDLHKYYITSINLQETLL